LGQPRNRARHATNVEMRLPFTERVAKTYAVLQFRVRYSVMDLIDPAWEPVEESAREIAKRRPWRREIDRRIESTSKRLRGSGFFGPPGS